MVFNAHETAILDRINFQEIFLRLTFIEQIIILSLAEQLKTSEIAARLHTSPRNCNRILHQIRHKLKSADI